MRGGGADGADQRRIAARTEPVLYVIEDAHWIDEASESMLADEGHGLLSFARCPRRRFRPGP
jgi:hypothetical protein